ncbi:hypothetical protein QRW98_17530 [Clostridioides difficile]|nr:hypothetical protein [Clostridioides difficile]MDL5075971.1 hypothetical protein [Clostridioides difficile]
MDVEQSKKVYLNIGKELSEKMTKSELNKFSQEVENLRQKINNETMKYSEILTIANLIGYEVVWKKKEK